MKFLILSLILAATAAGQSTGDYLLQRKTSTGYEPKTITPESGKVLSWDGSGNPTNITPITSLTWEAISGKPSTFAPIIGSGANDAVAGNDSRLTNARTPTAHKSSHATGGSDALTPGDIGAATAAQGTLADTALQPGSILTGGGTITPKSSGNLDFNDLGGTVDNAAVVTAVEEDPAAVVEALDLDPNAIADALNWQPYTMAKLFGWESGTTPPLRVITIGDSLSTGINLAHTMGQAGDPPGGVIGLNAQSSSGLTGNTTDWIAPIDQIAVGGNAIYYAGSSSGKRADRLILGYIKEPASGGVGGSFDYSTSTDGGSTWSAPTTVNTANASKIGAVTTVNLSNSNSVGYQVRINNVITGAVKLVYVGLYNSTGGGVIQLQGLANLSGLDIVNFGNISAAVFDPLWTALAPDLALVCFADNELEWNTSRMVLSGGSTTNASTTINFSAYPARAFAGGNHHLPYPRVGDRITGAGIPAGTYITAHTEGTTTATISQAATATASDLTFTIPGAWTDFYARCKAAFSATDFIQISQNPQISPETSTLTAWQTGTAYVIGDRRVRLASNGLVFPTSAYVCTSNHTSGASTEPGVGGSWETVWEVDNLDPASITAGNAIAAGQAAAQKAWAVANNESFINGFAMFRGHAEGVATGLLSNDGIHPSNAGYRFKNQRVWDAIPVSRLFWNNFGTTDSSVASVFQMPSGFYGEFTKPLHIRQSNTGGLVLWDRTNITSQSTASQIYNSEGNLFLGVQGGSNAAIGGKSTFVGLHPEANGRTLGGRGSFWWNVGGAGLRLEYRAITASDAVVSTDYTVDVTANDATVTLPLAAALNATVTNSANAAAGAEGKIYIIKNSTAANTTTIATTSSQTIDGSAPGTLSAGQSIKVQSTGSGWITIP